MLNSTFASALQIQGRVIGALILREVKARYQGFRLGYFWALIEPMIHLAVWMIVMVVIRHRKPVIGDSILIFLATGLIPFMMFRNVCKYIEGGYRSNRALLAYPVVFPIDLILSRWILESATMIIVAIIVFTGIVAAGQSQPPDNYPALIAATSMLLLLGLGLGMFNAVVTQMSRLYDYVWSIVSRFLYFTSGIFFIPDTLPMQIQEYLWYNPIAQGIAMFRDAFFAGYNTDFYSTSYMLSFAFTLAFIGLFFERRVRGTRRGEAA